MSTIRTLSAREILDSRGEPTLEVTLQTEKATGVAGVPAGASTGSREAHELRDGDARYHGRGVRKAIAALEQEIAPALVGKEYSQTALDEALIQLDGTDDRSHLGANTLLGVSMAFARATAQEEGIELYHYINALWGNGAPAVPQPHFNILNGGAHADSGISVQECMITFPSLSVAESMERASATIGALKRTLRAEGKSTGVGDEGGFAPKLTKSEEALAYITRAIAETGEEARARIALDIAATEFQEGGAYVLDGTTYNAEELRRWYTMLVEQYRVVSIEDPYGEDGWDDFAALKKALPNVRIVGDDLTVTNARSIREAAKKNAIGAVIIKPNQVGTLSETLLAAAAAHDAGIALMVSHRSGETTDTFVADLAVGLGAPYCKFGSLSRGERVSKYNRLLEIEAQLSA